MYNSTNKYKHATSKTALIIMLCIAVLGLGAMVSGANTRTISYSYDTSDQLIKAVFGNNTTVEYVYDDMGNRLIQTTSLTDISGNSPPYAAY